MINNVMLVSGVHFTLLGEVHKSACHNFMDAGRRQETPGSETMDSLLFTAIVMIGNWFSELQFPQGDAERPRWYLLVQWVEFQKRNFALRVTKSFIIDSRQTHLVFALEGEATSIFQGRLLCKHP